MVVGDLIVSLIGSRKGTRPCGSPSGVLGDLDTSPLHLKLPDSPGVILSLSSCVLIP